MIKLTVNQFFKYCIIGLLSTVINYVLFLCLYWLGFFYIFSGGLGYLAGAVFGLFLNKTWTFASQNEFIKLVPRYALAYFIGLLLHSVVQWSAVNYFNVAENLSQIVGITVTMVNNFLFLKFFVFKNSKINCI